MHRKFDSRYVKHVYWLSAQEEAVLRETLRFEKITLGTNRWVVCGALDAEDRISSAGPRVWSEMCSRQGSWYRASPKNGLYLVISSFELKGLDERKAALITQSSFRPERHASVQEKQAMISEPDFERRVPQEWRRVGSDEQRAYLAWARRLGSPARDFEFLLLSHTANHANFIDPRFYVEERGGIVPYSIDRSAHLCSCCLELFQVLGEAHPRKLVSPCPGACRFARLTPDRYFLVERP